MTTAICLRCGNFKFGAFVPCDHCGHFPTAQKDRIEHMLFSDHALTDDFLQRASAVTKTGERIEIDNSAFRPGSEETVTMLMTMLALLQTGQPLPPEIDRMLGLGAPSSTRAAPAKQSFLQRLFGK